MENKNIRKKNLESLLEKHQETDGNTKASFAGLLGIAAAQLSQMIGEKSVRNIGDRMARKIESALKLPNGWMDSIQTSKMNEAPVCSETAPSENYLVDVLDVTASAGYGNVISSEVAQRVASVSFSKEEAATLFRKRPSKSVKVITVTGDSMSGTIELGDYIFVDVEKGYFDGDGVYVFIFKGHILVKRIQLVADCYMVVADNPDYAPWEINEENEGHFKIIGRVLYCNSMKEIG